MCMTESKSSMLPDLHHNQPIGVGHDEQIVMPNIADLGDDFTERLVLRVQAEIRNRHPDPFDRTTSHARILSDIRDPWGNFVIPNPTSTEPDFLDEKDAQELAEQAFSER